jgi:hypothetical protein
MNKGDQVETYVPPHPPPPHPTQQEQHYPHTFILKHSSTQYHTKVVALFSNKMCVCLPLISRWLHGLIETYAEPNPDKA